MNKELPLDDIIEWDVLNWAKLIELWTPLVKKLPLDAKILAIGERNGGLSLWLALMGYKVICTDVVDISEKASMLHEKHNVTDKIEYRLFDVVNDKLDEQFDLIVAKSVIGGVKETRNDAASRSLEVQKKAVNNIYEMLRPAGLFLSAENTEANALTRSLRAAMGKSKGWRYIKANEIPELFNRYNILQIKTFGILPSSFSSQAVNKIMHGLNKSILSLLPSNTKYIAFVAAQKIDTKS